MMNPRLVKNVDLWPKAYGKTFVFVASGNIFYMTLRRHTFMSVDQLSGAYLFVLDVCLYECLSVTGHV